MTLQLIIVEDDASTRRSLERWASTSGYQVRAFDSASAFLAGHLDPQDSFLILDLGLPDVGGGELKRSLVANGRDIPTVFITAFSDEQAALELRGVKSPRVLHKPFELASLEAAIESERQGAT